MKRTLCLFSTSCLILLTSLFIGADVAEAQLVQVGPGYVKAPFVRVYQTPHGTTVRAPFTHVENGVPFFGRHMRSGPGIETFEASPVESYHQEADTTEISLIERQRRLVGKSSLRLNRDLSRFRRATHWQTVLQLPSEFQKMKLLENSSEVAQPDRAAVEAALENFEQVAGNPRYRKIAQLKSFRTTHRLLREYVSLLSLPSASVG